MYQIEQHNSFHLEEDPRRPPKEFFKLLVGLAEPELSVGSTVLDVGCAAGAFLYYLQSLYPALSLSGMDVSPDLVARAKQTVADARFSIGDIYTGDRLPHERFDIVFMSGVNYLFPDYEPWLRNLISVTRGVAFVYGIFNSEDLDVYSVVRRSGDKTSSTPWNLISEKSVSMFLESLNVRHEFFRWSLPVENPRVHADPMRTWTIETKDSRFLVVNGMQMIHPLAILRIEVQRSES
jgi:SAM-dependent methyltransferase